MGKNYKKLLLVTSWQIGEGADFRNENSNRRQDVKEITKNNQTKHFCQFACYTRFLFFSDGRYTN